MKEALKNSVHVILTNEKFISDILINDFCLDPKKTLIVNSPTEKFNSFLLPKYFKKKRRILEDRNIEFKGVFNSECIELLISNEIKDCNNLIVNTAGLSYESVEELKRITKKISLNGVRTFLVIQDLDISTKYHEYSLDNYTL